jgi:hypothetical protein
LLIQPLLLDQSATDRSIPVDVVPRRMGPPRGNTYDRQRSLGLSQDQQYPDSTTYHDGPSHGDYRDVAHNYDEGEEEAADEFEGGVDQPYGDDEEAQEHEPDPAVLEEEHEYPGNEPHEDDEEEEQGYGAHDEEDDEAGEPVEEGEGEDEDEDGDGDGGGHSQPAPPGRRWRW